MKPEALTFRKAAASDLDAVTAIYDSLHAQEDAGRVTIGWVTGVYPIRYDAEQALARGAYTRGSATGRRTSCRARSTASRMYGSCCSKRNYKFTVCAEGLIFVKQTKNAQPV